MAINDSAVVPLYQQVKDDIRAAIESGKYKTNEKIPPEPELSAEYSVSRITVRRAVEELCAEGYLVAAPLSVSPASIASLPPAEVLPALRRPVKKTAWCRAPGC
jgi:DNA-binding FadR family transcriptional regulator